MTFFRFLRITSFALFSSPFGDENREQDRRVTRGEPHVWPFAQPRGRFLPAGFQLGLPDRDIESNAAWLSLLHAHTHGSVERAKDVSFFV